MKLAVAATLSLTAVLVSGQTVRRDAPRFMGSAVTFSVPETDAAGFNPKGPSTVCVELKPTTQCYTPPEEFGLRPSVDIVQLDRKTHALFFQVASGGVSSWRIHFAVLVPGDGKYLHNIFHSSSTVSNQSQHVFWSEPQISDSQLFVTADYIHGPNEGHYGPHRYLISCWVRQPSTLVDGLYYALEDQYMTVRAYDLDTNQDLLTSEKPEILSRLLRVQRQPRK